MSQLYFKDGKWLTIDQIKRLKPQKEEDVNEVEKEEESEKEEPLPIQENKESLEDIFPNLEKKYLEMDIKELQSYARAQGVSFRGNLGREKVIKLLKQHNENN